MEYSTTVLYEYIKMNRFEPNIECYGKCSSAAAERFCSALHFRLVANALDAAFFRAPILVAPSKLSRDGGFYLRIGLDPITLTSHYVTTLKQTHSSHLPIAEARLASAIRRASIIKHSGIGRVPSANASETVGTHCQQQQLPESHAVRRYRIIYSVQYSPSGRRQCFSSCENRDPLRT